MNTLRKHLKAKSYHKSNTDFQSIAIGKRAKKYFSVGIQISYYRNVFWVNSIF